jgi:small subunit ribosomal protein S2
MIDSSVMEKKHDQAVSSISIEEMFTAGAHYGYKRSRRHPTASPYIFGLKNRVEIFDLEKTLSTLKVAKDFVYELGKSKKQLLVVGCKFEARGAVLDEAGDAHLPYVANRWIGGTLTNIIEIRKRVDRLVELRSDKESGELSKYTKKERLLLDREIEHLENNFGGVVDMPDLPSALFIVDTKEEHTAVREANRLNIPVVGLSKSDCELSKITYPIVGNDASRSSIKFFVHEIITIYKEGTQSIL